MSWKIEKIFTDTGAELSTGALSTSLGSAIQSVYDGRFMWVTCTNGIAIYEFWGQSSGDEPTVDEVDDLLWPRYTEEGPLRKLKLITFINISAGTIKRSTRYLSLSVAPGWGGGAGSTTVGAYTVTFTQKRSDLLITTESSTNSTGVAMSPYWISKVGDKMVVSSGANFSRCWIFDIATQRPETSFSLGSVVANSNMIGSNGRIWFVNTFYNDGTAQRLFNYKLSDSTLGSSPINVRPSDTRTWLADGFNGQIYVTNHNGVSVTRHNSETGVQNARIRTNALPTKIWSDQNRSIMVNSFGGMLTLVDWDDDGVHNDYSCEYEDNSTVAAFAFDPTDITKVWYANIDGTVKRYNLVDKQQYETGPVTQEVKEWVQQAQNTTITLAKASATDVSINGASFEADGSSITFDSDNPIGVTETLATYTAPADDWTIVLTNLQTPDWMTAVPSRTYTTSTGEVRTLRPYMFVCDGNTVRLFALDYYLVRDNYFEVNGQGAVVGGTNEYFGE